jgi:bacterioferritin
MTMKDFHLEQGRSAVRQANEVRWIGAVSGSGGTSMAEQAITRDKLAELLNEDLSREYQAIIAYVVYSQVLKGAEYMNIADQLEQHAHQELDHALIISRQIDYLGKMPSVTAKPVKISEKPKGMLRFDLDNENETILNYRERVRQCEALGEFAMAEQIREILVQEQDHQIDLATALGEDVPDLTRSKASRTTKTRR